MYAEMLIGGAVLTAVGGALWFKKKQNKKRKEEVRKARQWVYADDLRSKVPEPVYKHTPISTYVHTPITEPARAAEPKQVTEKRKKQDDDALDAVSAVAGAVIGAALSSAWDSSRTSDTSSYSSPSSGGDFGGGGSDSSY